MALRQTILDAQKTAMKEGSKATLSTLRMVWSAVRNSEIDKGQELKDEEVEEIIARQVKQLKDAMIDFNKGGRADLFEQARAEVDFLNTYLPKQLSESELEKIVRDTLSTATVKNQGQIMGAVMKQVKGQADGQRVREMVEKFFSNQEN